MILTCLDDSIYEVSSPYKVFSLLAVVNVSEKTPLNLRGWHTSLGVPLKPPITHLKNKIIQALMTEIILIKT